MLKTRLLLIAPYYELALLVYHLSRFCFLAPLQAVAHACRSDLRAATRHMLAPAALRSAAALTCGLLCGHALAAAARSCH